MSLLLLLVTPAGAPVFPPPPPSLPTFALPAGSGGVARVSAAALRARARVDLTRQASTPVLRPKDRN